MISFTPTEFIAATNQTLEYAYSDVFLVGEVASYKVNQGKWVFFDIKDEESSISCFMSLWSLRVPLEDGMKVAVKGIPKLTKWGKFSFTVQAVKPVGEGSLKKAFELLKKKLTAEGLFDVTKKRPIPSELDRIGVISSTQAAGYADFIKIINARWGGMKITVAHTQVQGMEAPDQIIRALKYFNERSDVQIIAILRGGGSADDLSCFNDEQLVRAIAASKILVITGIGHEVDESLSDLAADVKASTPSNAAEMLSRDRLQEKEKIRKMMKQVGQSFVQRIDGIKKDNKLKFKDLITKINEKITNFRNEIIKNEKILEALNPEKVLKQGYAILTGKISPGEEIGIVTYDHEIKAEVTMVKERKTNG